MKKRFFFIILLLSIILLYVTNITQIPEKLVLLEGEKIQVKTLLGVNLKTKQKDIIETWQQGNIENQELKVTLLGKIEVKNISVTTLPSVKVIPLGQLIRTKTIYKWSFSNRYDRNNKYK